MAGSVLRNSDGPVFRIPQSSSTLCGRAGAQGGLCFPTGIYGVALLKSVLTACVQIRGKQLNLLFGVRLSRFPPCNLLLLFCLQTETGSTYHGPHDFVRNQYMQSS